jgi:C-terminal processing protease CtpA/Prc
MTRIPNFPLASALLALWMLTCCFAPPSSGQETSSAKNILFAKSLSTLIRSVTETVLVSHIEPPTRQEMVLSVIRNIASSKNQSVPLDLATTISDTKNAEDLYQLLASELTKLGVTETDSAVDLKVLEAAYHSCLFNGFNFIAESNAQAEEQLASNRYVGIGVQLSQLTKGEGQRFIGIFAGGPADEAGILKDDILEAVEDIPTMSTSLEEVITMLRGPESATVTVTVRTDTQPARKLSIVRRVVPVKTVHLSDKNHQERALLIRFDRITASSLNELQKLVAKFEEGLNTTKTIVLDLRKTTVSDIHYLHLFADGLLDELNLGQVESREGVRNLRTEDGILFGDRKIVFLVTPGNSDEIDLLSLAAVEAGLKVISISSNEFEVGLRPNSVSLSRNTIPVVGTGYFIQIATNRLLTQTGKRIDPHTLNGLIKRTQNRPKLNSELLIFTSELNQVLRNLED